MDDNDRTILAALSKIVGDMLGGDVAAKPENAKYEIYSSPCGELNDLAAKVVALDAQYRDSSGFMLDLANGRLDTEMPRHNTFSSPYKKLHSELRHLTWQICRIAEGDYDQRVSFSGDFSDAFNRMILDLRERKMLLQQLRESNASKDKLFAIIAHDLRAPFNSLLGFSEVMVREVEDQNWETVRKCAGMIHHSAIEAYDLLLNLLDWARQQRGSITVRPELFDLGLAIEYSLKTARVIAAGKEITIESEMEGKLPVRTDHTLFNAILRNLLGNAIKYTPREGTIRVGVAKIPGFYRISVQDNGMGIREEDMDKLFELESMYTTPGTEAESGTGLGLILCREFVGMLGGKIWVESAWKQGATFVFTIPDAV